MLPYAKYQRLGSGASLIGVEMPESGRSDSNR